MYTMPDQHRDRPLRRKILLAMRRNYYVQGQSLHHNDIQAPQPVDEVSEHHSFDRNKGHKNWNISTDAPTDISLSRRYQPHALNQRLEVIVPNLLIHRKHRSQWFEWFALAPISSSCPWPSSASSGPPSSSAFICWGLLLSTGVFQYAAMIQFGIWCHFPYPIDCYAACDHGKQCHITFSLHT